MKTTIRLEELGFTLFSIYLFGLLPFPWWYFPVLFFVPDLSMLGYLGGPASAPDLQTSSITERWPSCTMSSVYCFRSRLSRWRASSSSRIPASTALSGYGLKFSDSFTNTHLGRIGRESPR